MPADLPRNRFALWTAHRATGWWTATLAVGVAVTVFPHSLLLLFLSSTMLTSLLWVRWAQWRHGAVMCPRCADEVPVNAPERAAARAGTLRGYHRYYSRRFRVLDLTMMLAFMGLALGLTVGGATPVPSLWYLWMCLSTAVECYLAGVHRPLQPWCPQCRWGRGGGREPLPAPVPPAGDTVQA
jgi:hypothetical protein